jgi:hypothetical protein
VERTAYGWVPGRGSSTAAIDRMRANGIKPAEPMGEAWFMGAERKMYTELADPDAVKEMGLVDLSMLLNEIASGTRAFGHLGEWDEWFRYLLPDLIERSGETVYFETTIFQSVITAFMSIYWNGIEEHYEGFGNDVLSSLSVAVMDERFWALEETPPRPVFLDLSEDGVGRVELFWNSEHSDPSVSAGLFFCLKYLKPDELADWIESMVGIQHELWQGNLVVWFLGAFDYLKSGSVVPADIESARPGLKWEGSHVLGTYEEANQERYEGFNFDEDFLPAENIKVFFDAMTTYYSEMKILELAESFAKNEHLNLSTFNIPERLQMKLYG